MPRPKVHDERLAEALLEESTRMVAASGPEALSLRKLTEKVGTSTSAVYSLYGSRDALMKAVYDRALASFVESQDFPRTDKAHHDLSEMGRAYRRWAHANPHLYPVMFVPSTDEATVEERKLLSGPIMDRLTAAIERCKDSGYLRADVDAAVAATQLWAMVHGYISLELMGLLAPDVTGRSGEEIDDAFTDLLRSSVAIYRA